MALVATAWNKECSNQLNDKSIFEYSPSDSESRYAEARETFHVKQLCHSSHKNNNNVQITANNINMLNNNTNNIQLSNNDINIHIT